jgi:hypothetical protein
METETRRVTFIARHVPITGWIRGYRWGKWLTLDLIAGVSVAALLIPESMGYAGVAGLPPEVGLYAPRAPRVRHLRPIDDPRRGGVVVHGSHLGEHRRGHERRWGVRHGGSPFRRPCVGRGR